jgi:acetolactate synthase-1/2/3 large subunit
MGLGILRQTNTIRGGEIVSRMLAAEGVAVVFGIIDGTYFGMYSTFEPHGIKLVTPRHETSAVHMAGAYARLTGKLGVCMASNGPGVANALPGVAVENAEGNRVLLITSCRREGIIYPDRGGTYQYFPQVEVTAPMTKWSCVVPSIDRLAEVMRRALKLCFTGRPGVVHVDIPESIMNGSCELDPSWFRQPSQYRPTAPIPPLQAQVEAAADLLTAARLPLIHAGSGVIHAHAGEAVMTLADLLAAPVTTSWGARAAVDERRDTVIPMIHTDAVNKARTSADAVLVLGSRLGETDWWGKAPYWGTPDQQQLIQVDIDPDGLGTTRTADLLIQADVGEFLTALIATLKQRQPDLGERRSHLGKLKKAALGHRRRLDKQREDLSAPLNSAQVAPISQEVFGDDAVVVVDGGNTAIWANFYHEVRRPGSLLGTAKMGMLGAGVAQAIGAKVACPDRPVYCIIGDGAMGFHQQEIETAVRNRLPVVYLVLCDKQWGMVKMNQQFALKPVKTLLMKSLGPDETINADLHETRFDDLARAMGAHGERVSDPADLKAALERAVASGRCAVVHVDVDPVKHMWAPSLRVFKAMHDEPKG